MKECLTEGKIAEARFFELCRDVRNGIKGRLAIENAFVLFLQVFPAEAAVPVNETDKEHPVWPKNAPHFAERGFNIVKETDSGHHEHIIELFVLIRKMLGNARRNLDSFFSGQVRHGPRGRSEERRVGKECRSRWSP